jgi:hypothetical protein
LSKNCRRTTVYVFVLIQIVTIVFSLRLCCTDKFISNHLSQIKGKFDFNINVHFFHFKYNIILQRKLESAKSQMWFPKEYSYCFKEEGKRSVCAMIDMVNQRALDSPKKIFRSTDDNCNVFMLLFRSYTNFNKSVEVLQNPWNIGESDTGVVSVRLILDDVLFEDRDVVLQILVR